MSDTLCNEKKKPYTFSEDGNSCIITETRTPRYWYNYLWNENHYCAQISQTGHGRSYYLSEKADMCMMNQDDARYIYLRDEKAKNRWNIGRRSIKYGSRKLSVRTQHWIFQNPVFLSEYCKFLAAVCTGRRIPGSVDFENKKYRGKTAPSQHIFSSQLLSGGLFLSAIL